MRWYVNDVSLQGQFHDSQVIQNILRDLVRLRATVQAIRANLRTTRLFPTRSVSEGVSLRSFIGQIPNFDLRRAVLNWLDRSGPFVDDDRLPHDNDYFEFGDLDVTDSGLGEAARRISASQSSSCFSFAGGTINFAHSPLEVSHGLREEPLGICHVDNYWAVSDLRVSALRERVPAQSWRELVEMGREEFPLLYLPDSLFINDALSREPFDAVIRERVGELFRYLQAYMAGRGAHGAEGPAARSIIENFFTGERALFTGESVSNQRKFRAELTFQDPEQPDQMIFAHWHGKISHRYFRLHFEWPVPPEAPRLRVVYLGPKITKK